MKRLISLAIFILTAASLFAQCPRPAAGSTVAEPEDLFSANGALIANFNFQGPVSEPGYIKYCFTYTDGTPSPTLRLNPGDTLTLNVKNSSTAPNTAMAGMKMGTNASPASSGPCGGETILASTTNLHFHGLNIPPLCHQDEVVYTAVQTGTAFQYKFQIPANEPPGLYWYHPHPHGFSEDQVLGGATGALIVQGIQQFNPILAGLPERVIVIRDQNNTYLPPAQAPSLPPPPSWDLSINYVPLLYSSYAPAVISMKPKERQFWRVANADADTILDLQVLYGGVAQKLGVVALDGVPLGWSNGGAGAFTNWQTDIYLPPGSRAEFILDGPASGVPATFITEAIDTGPSGDFDTARTLANIVTSPTAAEPGPVLSSNTTPLGKTRFAWLGTVAPTAQRSLYFSEQQVGSNSENIDFFITVDGQTPAVFSPDSPPNIVTKVGAVEDWTIENRTQEVHEFHMHQLHFLVLEENGVPVAHPELRDTYQVGYWDGTSATYPSIKVRMDFRDPEIAGAFVYHCHILGHEDAGMMGKILVQPVQPN
jgi:FtsP/CotA-like multicopper oxidase with cupredoxin domain